MRKIFLLTTSHLEGSLWFRDEEDFKVGMNYVAIEAARHPEIIVLAFILMSNHVHFVVMAWNKDEAKEFLNSIKHRYSLYYRRKYGAKEFLRRNEVHVDRISSENEEPEKAIAYTQMNCVAANICAHPSQYPWGTGNTFFNPTTKTGKRVGDLSARARKRLLHTDEEESIPSGWRINDAGFIPPLDYVDINRVEAIFRTPKRMNFFLYNSSKAKKRLSSDDNLPAFKDQSILAVLPDLCRSLFQKSSFDQLPPGEQVEFARQIQFRFSADVHQIARVCGISYADAAQLLDRV